MVSCASIWAEIISSDAKQKFEIKKKNLPWLLFKFVKDIPVVWDNFQLFITILKEEKIYLKQEHSPLQPRNNYRLQREREIGNNACKDV